MTASIAALDSTPLSAGPAHGAHVAQQMAQTALDIEQWLLLGENAALRVRQLGERLYLARRQDLREAAQQDVAADGGRAQALGRERRQALVAELEGELQAARAEVARLGDCLGQAQAELARLQADEVAPAALRDAMEQHARAEAERARLDAEIEQMAQSLAAARQELRGDAHARGARQAELLRGPVQASPLAGVDLEAELPAPPPAQRARLDDMVGLVGQVLRAPAGGHGTGAWGDAPMSPAASDLQARWAALVADQHGGPPRDVGQMIQWVMREAYLATTDDLRFYAHRLRFFTEVKRRVRAELTRARTFQSQHQHMQDGEMVLDGEFDKLSFPTTPEIGADGVPRAREPEAAGRAASARELESYIKDLEQQLSTIGDDAQLAQVELQNMAQKQQATLQTLSNLSKAMHETHMAIIRKIGS